MHLLVPDNSEQKTHVENIFRYGLYCRSRSTILCGRTRFTGI